MTILFALRIEQLRATIADHYPPEVVKPSLRLGFIICATIDTLLATTIYFIAT